MRCAASGSGTVGSGLPAYRVIDGGGSWSGAMGRDTGGSAPNSVPVAFPNGFRRSQYASVAIETAWALSMLVLAIAAFMEIAKERYAEDRMGRAARAAARAIALAPDAASAGTSLESIACAAIQRELDLDPNFDCGASWTLTVDGGLNPTELPGGPNEGSGTGVGPLFLVRIGWTREPWSLGGLMRGAAIATGLARSEPSTEP